MTEADDKRREAEERSSTKSDYKPDPDDGYVRVNARGEPWKDLVDEEDSTYLDEDRIVVPPVPEDYVEPWFSFRTLWKFTGPGWLMSIAYLDPGNIEADLQSGAIAEYKLLWVLFWATVLGLIFQRLAARLGVVTGRHLAQVCYENYPKYPRLMLWIMVELAIIGSDMQEVIGTAISIYLLSNRTIPLWGGALITIFDTFTFLFLDRYGLRKLEFFFAFLISVMAFSFGYQYFYDIPDQVEMLKGIFIPWCTDCGSDEWMQAVSALGAVIMPHNLYLHSALVKTRKIDRHNPKAVKQANKYFLIEGAIAIFISFIISTLVIGVFANGFYGITYEEAYEMCEEEDSSFKDVFYEPSRWDEDVDADLYTGGVFLGCSFGIACTYIWAVGILASGQSSTMTGTYSGQFAMEGFLNLKWKRWQRMLLTRTIALTPTLAVAAYSDIEDLTSLNDFMNAMMSVLLPFAVIPAVTFSSSKVIMGQYANGPIMKWFAAAMSAVFIGINIFFVIEYVDEELPHEWWVYLCVGLLAVIYVSLIAYLTVYMFICLGAESLALQPWVRKYYWVEDHVQRIEKHQYEVKAKA